MEERQIIVLDGHNNNDNGADHVCNLDGVGDLDDNSNSKSPQGLPTQPHRCADNCRGVCVAFTEVQNAARTYSNIHTLFQSGQFCDATLKTEDGARLPVHSIVICGDSDYFRALFTTPLHKQKPKEFLIKGISGEMLKTLIEFLYTRTICLAEDNVTTILEAADYLGIVRLKRTCCEFIASQVNETNCLGVRSFAASMFCNDLEVKAHKYLMKNFVEVATNSEEFLELTAEQAIQIFGSDELNVKSEELVWDAILRWISHRPDERREHIVDLIVQVRTGLMETQYFMEHVKDHPFVHGNEGCRPIVIETLRFLYDLEVVNTREVQVHVATPNIARPRIPHEVLFAIGGWSGGTPTNYIETYDTRADRWILVEEVDTTGPRAYHGTVVIGHEIIVIGGFDGNEYFNTTRAFNAVTKTWRSLAPMHTKRCYVSVALVEGKYVYAMGGYDGHHRQNTVEKYDSETNQWSMVSPMNAQRSDACATELDGKIYITGGFSGTECLLSAEMYDPSNNQWTNISNMRNRRSGVSCISYHNSVYVLGGFNGIARMASVEKYNPGTDTWTVVPDMYNPRSNFAVEVIDDMIFCIGGFNGATTIYHVECYDDRTNEWFEATDMNIYRSALSACVVTDLPNIGDYIHQHRDRLMEERRQRLFSVNQLNRENRVAT